MKLEGGCYCKQVRYKVEGEPLMKAQCHCRECQYMTGGSVNLFMMMPLAGFAITQGATKSFSRPDLPSPVTREFCPNCGTHLLTRTPRRPTMVIIKVGTLDDPAQYGGPNVAIFTMDKQPFHTIPDGVPSFERLAG